MLRALIDTHAESLAGAFYDVLLRDAEARSFLHHSVVQERLKPSLSTWLKELFSDAADADPAAFDERQRLIGEIHARIKIPMHLVMLGASVLQARIVALLRASDASLADRFDDLHLAFERIDRAMMVMSRSYVSGVETRARLEEAYRLFSLDQDVNLQRESQRASLMEWAQTTLFQILEPAGGEREFRMLANAPFGLWIRHRAGVMFEHSPELQKISQIMTQIDTQILPQLEKPGRNDRPVVLKGLREAVDQIAFLLAEMFQGLAEMESGRDALTRALNRRFLPSILTREINFANKHGSALSLLLVDIDHFKRVNDTHGHQAGDMVLRQVAEVLTDNIRPNDFLFRYGGEEFLIVLVEIDLAQAELVAERIRQALEAKDFRSGEQGLRVTASIGICQHAGHPDPDYLIKLADEALYRAKDAGRNRVVVAEAR